MKTVNLAAGCIVSGLLASPIWAQQVHEGTEAVTPAYEGQTRAALALKSQPFVVSEFVNGLNRPWAMDHLPNGKMIVTEVPGRIRIIDADGNVSAPVEGVPPVRGWGSRGLNDIILDPGFASNRRLYFVYLAAPDGVDSDNSDEMKRQFDADRQAWNGLSHEEKAANPWGHWRIASATLSGDEKRLNDVEVLLDTVPSRMAFDDEGRMLITTQRKSPMGMPELKDTLGMVLRINTDGSVPQDNPFVGNDEVNDMALVIGLRNANSLEMNPSTGEFWLADQGPTAGDELNVLVPGKDYGWPQVSYGRMGDKPVGTGLAAMDGTEQPIYFWSPVSMAPSDMMFYTGDMFPGWEGNLFLTGLSSMHLSRLVLVGNNVIGEERLLDEPGHRLRHVSQGPDGAIYVLEDMPRQRILKLTAPPAEDGD